MLKKLAIKFDEFAKKYSELAIKFDDFAKK